jgi:hypothetical protein
VATAVLVFLIYFLFIGAQLKRLILAHLSLKDAALLRSTCKEWNEMLEKATWRMYVCAACGAQLFHPRQEPLSLSHIVTLTIAPSASAFSFVFGHLRHPFQALLLGMAGLVPHTRSNSMWYKLTKLLASFLYFHLLMMLCTLQFHNEHDVGFSNL